MLRWSREKTEPNTWSKRYERKEILKVQRKNDLIEICSLMMKEIAEVSAQKRKLYEPSRMYLYSNKGCTSFLIRKSTVLKRTKKKEYKADLYILVWPNDYYDEGEGYEDR